MADARIPQHHELIWPALQVARELGGSATVQEMNERVYELAGITKEQQTVNRVQRGAEGQLSEIEYRLNWARSQLKGTGALENWSRGVWAITEVGRTMTEGEMRTLTQTWRASLREELLRRI